MKYFFISIFLAVSFMACRNKPKDVTVTEEKLPEDFTIFYQRFFTDSVFQMNHIQFPLEGLPDHANSEAEDLANFRWKKEAWALHRDFDFEKSGYVRKFLVISDALLFEYIIHKNNGFGLERRFSKRDDGWYLIYYAGVNKLKERG